MLLCPEHVLVLNTADMSRHGSAFDAKMLAGVLGRVNDVGVLRLLSRAPLKSLTFRSNPGNFPGTHDGGHIVINTAPRLTPGPTSRIGITHESAQNDVEYYALVLTHEIGHALANRLTGTGVTAAAHQAFLDVFAQGRGVTQYALDGCGEGRTLSEYFAETFTAAVALPQLRERDPAGYQFVDGLLNAVRLAPPA